MDRRQFVGALTSGIVVARSAIAQPSAKVYRVGFLLGATAESVASLFGALEQGLRELGYVDGRNVVFERRYADGKMERLPEIAAELVRLRVDVIVTGSNVHVEVRRATATIPIVMVFAADPVGAGFVASRWTDSIANAANRRLAANRDPQIPSIRRISRSAPSPSAASAAWYPGLSCAATA